MIHRLRRKFIVSSMLALILVLGVIVAAINIINYKNVVETSDAVLNLLSESGGTFQAEIDRLGFEVRELLDGDFKDIREELADEDFQGMRTRRGGRLDSPELPFETRYFSVCLSAEGEVTGTELGRIAAVNAETAAEMAQQASRREKGFVGDYRFLREAQEDGVRILFVDCGQNLSFFRAFLSTSLLISALGLLAVFALIVLFSRQITRPAAESYEKQRRFITDAGHELKTPLTIINADADVLQMDVGEDNEWLLDIQRQTSRLAELTNDLVQLARMEETDAQKFVEFSLSEAAEDVAQSFQAPAMNGGKRFSVSVQPGLRVKGDEKSLRRLVSILLDNAVKYTNEGGEIRLDIARQGKYARITCYNTCDGIDKADIPHLFERFYRSEKSRNSEKGGSGIGLSIAQAVVQAHKGKITAVTEDERSLKITADIPLG